MGKYCRSLIDTSRSGTNNIMGTFVEMGERIMVDPDFTENHVGAVFRSVRGGSCWVCFKDTRPETAVEAAEELIKGEW